VRLGADPRMNSPDLRLDGYHFSAGGHSRAAETVAPVVLDLVHAAAGAAR
jgi:lysophospholipase L1-like esterase